MEDVNVPSTLIAPEQQRELFSQRKPTWMPDQGDGNGDEFGVVQRVLGNGIKVSSGVGL